MTVDAGRTLLRCFTDDGTHRTFWCIIDLGMLLNLVLVIPELGVRLWADVTVITVRKGRVVGRKDRRDSTDNGADLY